MTQDQANKIANVVIGVAAVGAAIVVFRNPSLRRMAWRYARMALAASGPALLAEARRAWDESADRQQRSVTRPARDMMGA